MDSDQEHRTLIVWYNAPAPTEWYTRDKTDKPRHTILPPTNDDRFLAAPPTQFQRFVEWRRWTPPPANFWDKVIRTILAGALFGYLCSQISLPPPPTSPMAEAIIPPMTQIPIPPSPPPILPSSTLSNESPIDTVALIKQGEHLIAQGKITESRSFFESAAMAGNPDGALNLAITYDPEFLKKTRIKDVKSNSSVASYWYEWSRSARKHEPLR